MTLQEAIASGKPFNRSIALDASDIGYEDSYMTAEDFLENGISLDDYNATDYVVYESNVPVVSRSVLIDAWNTARNGSTAVKDANSSAMFTRFVATLNSRGIKVS